MENTTHKYIPAINAVEGFNPSDFVRTISNDDGTADLYLDVRYRLLWFRLHRPNGKIKPEIVHVDEKSAVVCCKLYADRDDPDDKYIAVSYAQRFLTNEKFGDRFLEIAETAAIGRVLAAAGYGTQFCSSPDMPSGIIVDAPLEASEVPIRADTSSVTQTVPNPVATYFTGTQDQQYHTEPIIQRSDIAHMSTPNPFTAPLQTSSIPYSGAPSAGPQANAAEYTATYAPDTQESVESLLNSMSIDEAKSVVIDCGRYSGFTLGEVLLRKPEDLEWYVNFYAGKNSRLKAGAIVLMRAVTSRAG